MKKFLPLLLILCLALSLAACKDAAAPLPTIPAGTTEAKTEPAPETTPAPETEPADNGRGVVEGDVYINESLGIRIQLPEDCFFYTEKQLAQANNMSVDLFQDSDLADAIAQSGQLIDVIFSRDSGDNANMLIQPNNPALALYSMEQIFQLSEETYKTQFSAAGLELSTYETATVSFLGEDTTALHMVLSNETMTVDEYQLWATELSEDYMAIITVSFPTEGGDPQPLLDAFSTID